MSWAEFQAYALLFPIETSAALSPYSVALCLLALEVIDQQFSGLSESELLDLEDLKAILRDSINA